MNDEGGGKMEEELMKGEEGEGNTGEGGGPESPIMIQVKTEGGKVSYKYKCPPVRCCQSF